MSDGQRMAVYEVWAETAGFSDRVTGDNQQIDGRCFTSRDPSKSLIKIPKIYNKS